jgi:small redox-active disulfide protein 2
MGGLMQHYEVLGPGCANCKKLAQNVAMAAEQLGIQYTIEKVTDYEAIARSGVLKTPALIVDGELKFYGRVPGVDELKNILQHP